MHKEPIHMALLDPKTRSTSGCTCTGVIITHQHVIAFNTGDSRTLLIDAQNTPNREDREKAAFVKVCQFSKISDLLSNQQKFSLQRKITSQMILKKLVELKNLVVLYLCHHKLIFPASMDSSHFPGLLVTFNLKCLKKLNSMNKQLLQTQMLIYSTAMIFLISVRQGWTKIVYLLKHFSCGI